MSQNIIEQARILGTMLKDSDEFKKVQEKELAMMQNADAKKALDEHQQTREGLQMKQMQGEQLSQEEIEGFQALEAKMLENSMIKEFNDVREKFEALLNNVNQTINSALLGQPDSCDCGCTSTSCAPSSGCGPSEGCGC